jgi:hypothetical protein
MPVSDDRWQILIEELKEGNKLTAATLEKINDSHVKTYNKMCVVDAKLDSKMDLLVKTLLIAVVALAMIAGAKEILGII